MKNQKTMILLVALGAVMTLFSMFIPWENRVLYNLWIGVSYSLMVLAFVVLYVRNKERMEKKHNKTITFTEYMKQDKPFFMLSLALLSFGLKLLFRAFNLPQADIFQLFTSCFIIIGVLLNSKERKEQQTKNQ